MFENQALTFSYVCVFVCVRSPLFALITLCFTYLVETLLILLLKWLSVFLYQMSVTLTQAFLETGSDSPEDFQAFQ